VKEVKRGRKKSNVVILDSSAFKIMEINWSKFETKISKLEKSSGEIERNKLVGDDFEDEICGKF